MKSVIYKISLLINLFLSSCIIKEQTVTPDEAMKVASIIDSAISGKKPQEFNKLFNEKLLAKRVSKVSGQKVTNSMVEGIRDGLSKNNFGHGIIRYVSQNGFYQLVKHYQKEHVQHLIFRMFSEEGLNYHDFELTKLNNKVYVADIFIYVSGESISKTLSDFITTLDHYEGKAKEDQLKQINSIKTIKRLMDNRQFADAKSYYEKLPLAIQQQKLMQVIYLQVCSGLDNELYSKALNDFQSLFPNEPNMYLTLIDAYFLRKDYNKALYYVNKMDSLINKDPFLDYYRALMYKVMEEKEKCIYYLETLNKNMPEFGAGVLELINSYLEKNEFSKAKLLVSSYRNNPAFNQESLSNILFLYPGIRLESESD